VFTNGVATTVQFDSSASVDVTVTTGGNHGVAGGNLGTTGALETGMSYDSLYTLTVFNGPGQYAAQTTIQFDNFHNIPANAIGYVGVGNVLYLSSPVRVLSSAGVGAWTQTGSTFKMGTDSTQISWNAADSQFVTHQGGYGIDSRGITMPLGLLSQYTGVTLQLDQWLDDGINVWMGMAKGPGDPTSVAPRASPRIARTALRFSGTPLARGPVNIVYEVAVPGVVRIAICGMQGDLVRVLTNRAEPVGIHHVVWDGRGQLGASVPFGVYLATLNAAGGAEALRIVRIH
jgi:hypothetical protein